LGCATAKPSPDALRVDALELDGMKALKESDVTERIVTSATPWWSRWFPFLGGAEWFDVNTWQADLRRITRVYEARGYYQARVLEDVVTETGTGAVRLRVKVKEGEPATLRAVELRGVSLLGDVEPQLRARLSLHVGDVFLEERWSEAKAVLAAQLHEAGYAEAKVEGEAVVDLDAAKVDASLDVQPGARFRFGPVFAPTIGKVVPAKLIKEEAEGEVPQGAWYTDSALANAQARVFQMGVFSAVKVNRGIPDREKLEMPIVVDVREAPMRSWRIGGGGGGDVVRNELRGFVEYTDRNLGFARLFPNGALLDKLTLKLKGGAAALPNVVSLVQGWVNGPNGSRVGPFFNADVNYEVPRLFGDRRLKLETSLGVFRQLDNAFDYSGAEFALAVRWQPRVDLLVRTSLNTNVYVLNLPIQQMLNVAPNAAVG
jgi:translocation and assembly module TamA